VFDAKWKALVFTHAARLTFVAAGASKRRAAALTLPVEYIQRSYRETSTKKACFRAFAIACACRMSARGGTPPQPFASKARRNVQERRPRVLMIHRVCRPGPVAIFGAIRAGIAKQHVEGEAQCTLPISI
jgi:hypothetical protein